MSQSNNVVGINSNDFLRNNLVAIVVGGAVGAIFLVVIVVVIVVLMRRSQSSTTTQPSAEPTLPSTSTRLSTTTKSSAGDVELHDVGSANDYESSISTPSLPNNYARIDNVLQSAREHEYATPAPSSHYSAVTPQPEGDYSSSKLKFKE